MQFKDAAGVGIDLTGWTAYAQVWNRSRTTKYADFAVTYIARPTGQIKIALTDTQTATFPDEAHYDVLLEDSSGLRNYYIEGTVYVSEGYTAP